MRRQVDLDRESGAAVLQIRAGLITLAGSYRRLDQYRSVTLAACPLVPTPACPEALAAFRAAAKLESAIQRRVELEWQAGRLRWRAGAGARDGYPEFDFPVATGTEEDLGRGWMVEFERRAPTAYSLSIRGDRIGARAEIRRNANEWNAAWKE